MWKYNLKTLPESQEPQRGKRDQEIAGTSHFAYLPTHELTGVCIRVHRWGACPHVLTDNKCKWWKPVKNGLRQVLNRWNAAKIKVKISPFEEWLNLWIAWTAWWSCPCFFHGCHTWEALSLQPSISEAAGHLWLHESGLKSHKVAIYWPTLLSGLNYEVEKFEIMFKEQK